MRDSRVGAPDDSRTMRRSVSARTALQTRAPAVGTSPPGSQVAADPGHSAGNTGATAAMVWADASKSGKPADAYPMAGASASPSSSVPNSPSSRSQAPNAPGTVAGSRPAAGTCARPCAATASTDVAAGTGPCPQITRTRPLARS